MKRTYILAGIVLLIFLLGCTRYDDGPWISFRTAKNRVLGTWKVEKLLINDLDSTELYREQIGCEWEFSEEKLNEQDTRFVFYYKTCKNDTIYAGRWYFNYNNKQLSIFTLDDTTESPIGPIGRGGTWLIQRLTNNEMYLWINPPDNFLWGASDETTYYLELKKL